MSSDRYFQEYGPMRRRRPPDDPFDDERPPRNEPPRRPRRRRSVRRRSAWPVVLFILILLLGTPVVLPYALDFAYPDQALPGVYVQGEAVGGQSSAEITARLSERHQDFLRRPLTLVYGNRVWEPTLEDVGAAFDIADVAATAVSAGRHGDPITRWRELWRLYRQGLEVTPQVVVDLPQMQQYLLGLSNEIEQPPQDAALSIAAARIVGTPSTPGTQLLIDASANDMLLAMQNLAPQEVSLRTRQLDPLVNDTALVLAQSRAAELLQSPLELVQGDRRWVLPPDRLAELLRITTVDDAMNVQVDQDVLARTVEGLAQLSDTGTAEPRLRFVDGQVQIVAEGVPGWRMRQDEAIVQIADLLLTPAEITRTLTLPGDVVEPQITEATLASLGIVELVGEGVSSFAGSAEYRITNIKAGAARMDGVLIAPGEEFSFNRQLGEVNAENGFVEGYAIIGNRTQLEWGGGVCQDSTTVFRAAFWAGLPITERHAHAFYISWYDRFGLGPNGDGQGLDAAIYTGVNDLKFVNDTDNWLLMQTEVDEVNQVLTVRLYGTKPNREVRLEGPYISNEVRAPSEPVYVDDPSLPRGTVRQTDTARSGRDITIERVVIENGVEIRRDTFFTRFKAWPNIYVRGTR